MPERAPAPPLRLNVDTAALAGNWRELDRLSGKARAGAAVKANAYGTGAREAVRVLSDAGCRDFFVAHWCEAEQIAGLVDPASIAMLHGPSTPEEAHWAIQSGVRPVINSFGQARCWIEAGGGLCDVMVDTGINRLGMPWDGLSDPVLASLEIDTLHSHLASAEEPSAMNLLQLSRWSAAREVLRHRRASLANSAGIALGEAFHGDLTRPGLALYGGIPCETLAPHIRQVARIEAAILQARDIAAGDTVGYNATFTAPGPMRVGVISLGYADGYLRCWSGGKGSARGGDAFLPVLGRVSMDMTVIDLTGTALREGDWVEISYQLPHAASASGLSQYELLTLIGRRFGR